MWNFHPLNTEKLKHMNWFQTFSANFETNSNRSRYCSSYLMHLKRTRCTPSWVTTVCQQLSLPVSFERYTSGGRREILLNLPSQIYPKTVYQRIVPDTGGAIWSHRFRTVFRYGESSSPAVLLFSTEIWKLSSFSCSHWVLANFSCSTPRENIKEPVPYPRPSGARWKVHYNSGILAFQKAGLRVIIIRWTCWHWH